MCNHFRYYLEPASPLKSLTGNNKFPLEAQQNFNCTISKPVSGRAQAVINTPVTSTYSSSPNNFPTKFTSDNNAITRIQAPITKTNGQTNGANRTNALPRNLNNNVTSSAADNDFVADFSTAVIFNGATYNNHNNNNSSSKLTKTDSSYTTTAQNGTNFNENANFADFEHNPIFNAGMTCLHTSKLHLRFDYNRKKSTNSPLQSIPNVMGLHKQQFQQQWQNGIDYCIQYNRSICSSQRS